MAAVLLKAVFVGLAVALPLVGVWIASSLAAFENAAMEWVALAGLLAFPLVPLAWDGVSTWRRRRRAASGKVGPRILTFFDRFVLRTLVVNLLLVVGLLATHPKVVFTALSARGDWMLDQAEAPWAEKARARIFWLADRLEWLHEATQARNPYEDLVERDDDDRPVPTPTPTPVPVPRGDTPPVPEAGADDGPIDPFSDAAWPFRSELHPAVAAMPPDIETSIESVGRYIAEQEADPTRRIKALHDYVATRVAYDAPSLVAGRYPPQDAETVFRARVAVCAGYANLMAALGDVTGDEIEVVVGHARDSEGGLGGLGHAWNAAQIGDRWVLFDPTWDAGTVEGAEFTRAYSTTFLMSPPEVFGVTHFPEDPRWQLRAEPLSRGDFLRQPPMRGGFFARRLELIDPARSQSTVDANFTVRIGNPLHQPVGVFVRRRGDDGPFLDWCDRGERTAREAAFACDLPGAGEYEVGVFAEREFLGALQVNARG